MTRTSLPVLLSRWIKTVMRRSNQEFGHTGDFWALQDVSFSLREGESLALVGENGAGKTTILKLLAKITKPTMGTIRANGTLSALIELGAGFHPDLSGRENIYLNGTILGLKRQEIEQRFDQIVDFAELEKFIDTPVKRYSSGMAVRLGFAVAASIDPDILLVDEVLAVGDSAFRLKCMNRIQELIENGTTLIFVSHNMGLVKAVCEKAIYIEKGTIKQFGETGDVVDAYNHALDQRRIHAHDHVRGGVTNQKGVCEISRVTIIGKGLDQDPLMPSRAALIGIEYHAFRDVGEIAIVLRIIRSDGLPCAALYSQKDQASLLIEKGDGRIEVTLSPLQLFPGTYYVVVTIKDKDQWVVHDMAYSDWFQVQSGWPGENDLDAVFEPNRRWECKRRDQENPDTLIAPGAMG
ncbi:MAG: ABC transporter ATP-binding protein [Anaerolineae bacterium]|nr:ABC transporter ATP-binding protein [Anaerolineae bacterium]